MSMASSNLLLRTSTSAWASWASRSAVGGGVLLGTGDGRSDRDGVATGKLVGGGSMAAAASAVAVGSAVGAFGWKRVGIRK